MKVVHIALLVSDLKQASQFYEKILGLQRIERPQLAFDGIWYGLEHGQEIHLMLLDNPYQNCDKPSHGGRDNHVAMQTDQLNKIINQLENSQVPYTMSKSGRAAIFFRDPDGNTIELMG